MSGASGSPGRFTKCKEHQRVLELSQEVHGDGGALGANRQTLWLTRMEPFFYMLMAPLLDKKSDTHIVALTTERLEKRPYFKIQDYKVMPVDVVAGKFPHMFTKVIQDEMRKLKMSNQQANYAYGLIVITCSNDVMVPVMCMPLSSPDIELPHLPVDDILRTINEEPIT
eukprot:gene11005-18969_t